MYAELEQRVCKACGLNKSIKEFGKDRTQPRLKRSYRCKSCKKIELRKWKKDNPEKVKIKQRKDDLKKNYGITVDEYNKMFIDQDGRCAICFRHQSELKRRLAVDHCKKTRLIRSLLCDNCNPGIGYFKESIELLESAKIYLMKFKK